MCKKEVHFVGFFKKDTAVFNSTDKKIRNIFVVCCVLVLIIILFLNFFVGVGKSIRPVIFYSNGKNLIYNTKDNSYLDNEYTSYYSGFIDFNKTGEREFKAHFDSDTYFKAQKNGDAFDIYYFDKNDWNYVLGGISAMRFAQNGKDAVFFEPNENGNYTSYFFSNGNTEKMFENCSDAMAVGNEKSEYFVYDYVSEDVNKAMFSNFKDEPFELNIGSGDMDTVSLSADDRKLMIVSNGERKLYVYNLNVTEGNTTEALEVGKSVIKASFTGLKNDFAFLDAEGDFYYSSGGYTFLEDEDVKKFETGYDVMSLYYLKNNGEFYSFYVGEEKKLDEGVEDFCYFGSNNTAVIKDYDKMLKKGKLYLISSSNVTETDIDIERFCKYWKEFLCW